MKFFLCLLAPIVAFAFISSAEAKSPATQDGRREVVLSSAHWTALRDTAAAWQGEDLYLPGTPISAMQVHPPTGGWAALQGKDAVPVTVPGTTEEYFSKQFDLTTVKSPRNPKSPLEGVTWWSCHFTAPSVSAPHRFVLRFSSVRLRAEVFVNQKFVGYDIVGDTPFAVDITDDVQPGQPVELDVRVTNPGGVLDWTDTNQVKWGKYLIPAGRDFGGITGNVVLQVLDPAYIDNLAVLDTPDIHTVTAQVELTNTGAAAVKRDVAFEVADATAPETPVFTQKLADIAVPPGASTQSLKITVPTAEPWSVASPHLYLCRARLLDGDKAVDGTETHFGFRTFALDGLGQNAVVRVDGKRVFLLTAISWGFWPVTGLIPTQEMAEKQIAIAKRLGLNMLNFHRCIGSPVVLDAADRDGLLYFEEPGGYATGGADPFAQTLAREKFLRMVKRDRSHPSLIIYNMINEQWQNYGADKNPAVYAVAQRDMRDAHAIDPSRLFVYSSAWDRGANGADEIQKLNMRPYDDQQYQHGWWDYHRAGGPMTYEETTFTDPTHHYGFSDNTGEVVYHGEEGAISSPPRLALIKKSIDASGEIGWDGAVYLDWYDKFTRFMDDKKLHVPFGTLDDFTKTLGSVSFEHQGRKIEDTRVCDVNDGYAINGWEAMVFDNHSGVVDCYRNPKGDPDLISYYTQPLYVAVKLRHQFAEPGGSVLGDFFILNESDLKGDFTLKYRVTDPAGKVLTSGEKAVTIHGGDLFSELLDEAVKLPAAASDGFCRVEAQLLDAAGDVKAKGHDEFLTVDWKNEHLPAGGAVLEANEDVRTFLAQQDKLDVPDYDDAMGPLKWLLITRSPLDDVQPIPAASLSDVDGTAGRITTTFFQGDAFAEQLAQRHDTKTAFTCAAGATPDAGVTQTDNYGVRWEGKLVPPVTGSYRFALKNNHRATLLIGGKVVLDNKPGRGIGAKETKLDLVAGQPVDFRVDYVRGDGDASATLLWLPPGGKKLDPAQILARAQAGTSIIIADHAEDWLVALKQATGITYTGTFKVGNVWLGGQFFVREHPLFAGLPVNCALHWPYQAVVDDHRLGVKIEGEQLVAGCWQSTSCQLGTAVGIVPFGKGRIIFSTLNIVPKLGAVDPPSLVARKLLANFIACP